MSVARAPLALAALVLSGLAACAPEKVDINVHDIFTGDAARYALQNQMPAALLAQVGGYLPVATWPPAAAPLLLDVKVVAQNKIDLAGSQIVPGDYSGIRMHWTTLVASQLTQTGPLTPKPTQIELYVGPAAATSITDTGVIPLASGAYPDKLLGQSGDGGTTSSADAGTDGGVVTCGLLCEDAGSPDAGAPDAGSHDAGSGDAGSADAGSGAADAGASGQTLVFTSDAQLGLGKLVFANQPFSLFVVVHMPIDTATNPTLPTGGADLLFDIQFELAR
jgi:hypothetical protein